LFGTILAMTAIILIALKFRKTKNLLWLFEGLAVFSTLIIVLSAFLPNETTILALTALIMILRYTNKENVLIRNLVSLTAIAGAGAFLGISLGLTPILAFIIILAVYDIIAVFGTKHMITIGKQAVKNNYAFMVSIPTKKHDFELGNGDMVIPLCVASSIMINGPFRNNGLITALILGASFLGLVTSIYLVSKKKISMPALPPQTLLMILIIAGATILGM
jgi:presenilin-like A22 family membrane protease